MGSVQFLHVIVCTLTFEMFWGDIPGLPCFVSLNRRDILASRRLWSTGARMSVQQLIRTNTEDITKLHINGPLWGTSLIIGGFLSTGVTGAESVSMSWRYDVLHDVYTSARPCGAGYSLFNWLAPGTIKLNLSYRQVSDIRRTWVGNEIVDHSDVVGQALLQLHLHSPLNTWLQYIVRRKLQAESRNI